MNHLGMAASTAERDIEDAIGRVALWQGRSPRYRPVLGGISNTNWRVEIDGDPRAYFVKVPGRGTEMFIDRKAACAASYQAEAIGVGPKTFDYLEADGIEIAEFIEGRRASTHRDFADPAIRREALRFYKRLHDSPSLPLTKTVFDMIDEHLAQVAELGGSVPADIDWLDRQYRLARSALEAAGLDLVPCFNDPMPGNFLIGVDKSIMLIDFEYASNNDRLYDLAIWSGEMFFEEAIDREIIEEYFGRDDESLYARMMVHKALADIKWSTWAMVQNKISTLDFDFYKYGAWKYMRARSILRDPRFPGFLRAL